MRIDVKFLLSIVVSIIALYLSPAFAQTSPRPQLVSPTPGGSLLGNTAIFAWTSNEAPVTAWRLDIGTSYLGADVYSSAELPASSTEKTIITLPVTLPEDDNTIHVTLHYQEDSAWHYEPYAYSAITLPQTSCADWDYFTVDGKILFNSPWGQFHYPNGGWSQCITLSLREDGTLLPGWEYDWLRKEDSTDPYGVKTYPELIFGNKSGDKISATQDFTGIPVRLKEMPDFTIDLAYQEYGGPTEEVPSAARNIALESFFHGQPNDDGSTECEILGAGNPQGLPSNRRYEIMIWTEIPDPSTFVQPGNADDRILKLDTDGNELPIIIDDQEWEVWVHRGQDPAYIAFLAVNGHSDNNHRGEATVKWSSFVQWVRDNQSLHGNVPLNDNWCMGAFEFGSEVWWGAGSLEVMKFDVSSADETTPEIIFDYPAAVDESLQPAPLLQGTVTDRGGSGIEAVRIAIENVDTGEWLEHDSGIFQQEFSYTLALLNNQEISKATWELQTELSEGSYQLHALAFDKAGNYRQLADGTESYYPQAFTVKEISDCPTDLQEIDGDCNPIDTPDTTPPSVVIVAPTQNIIAAGAVALTGTATDASSVDRIELVIKNTTNSLWWDGLEWVDSYVRVPAALNASDWSYSVNLPEASAFYIGVWAWDSLQNFKTPPESVRFSTDTTDTNDTTPPEVVILNPTDNQNVTGTVTINGTASDNDAVQRVELVIKDKTRNLWWNGDSWIDSYTRITPSLSNESWSYSFTPPDNTSLFTSAWVWDNAGNYQSPPTWINFSTGSADTSPPTASITAPSTNSVSAGDLNITGTANDNVAVQRVELVIKDTTNNLWWDGLTWIDSYARVLTNDNGDEWEYSVTLPPNISVYLGAWAWDTSQNRITTPAKFSLSTN